MTQPPVVLNPPESLGRSPGSCAPGLFIVLESAGERDPNRRLPAGPDVEVTG